MTRYYYVEEYRVRVLKAEKDEDAAILAQMPGRSEVIFAQSEPVDWVETNEPVEAHEAYFTKSHYPGSHFMDKAIDLLDKIPPHGLYCDWVVKKLPCTCGVDQWLTKLAAKIQKWSR